MMELTPKEIVRELDKFIIGQDKAKKMVAIAMRNRWRTQKLSEALCDEVSPKNIIMIGSTGVGKTEIARRLAKLSSSPFIKVEATKFTEVGYVGRDVESIIRDLMEIAVRSVRKEETEKVKEMAISFAEERLLDILLPSHNLSESSLETREKMRTMWKNGSLRLKEIEIEVSEPSSQNIDMLLVPGMEHVGNQMQDLLGKVFPQNKKKRKMTVEKAWNVLLNEEINSMLDEQVIVEIAKYRVEKVGIVFIDEIDKVCSGNQHSPRGEVSREGVQRDLLPIVEGSTVNTKYGMIKTDHILFIAAGAFHSAKPSDLIPELQGRFPIQVKLDILKKDDFYRILTEPNNALIKQYSALLETEGVILSFTDEALHEIAFFTEFVNSENENIGARRLYTIMEKILTEISYNAPESIDKEICIDIEYVKKHLEDISSSQNLTKYIL
ncbi:MAG: ATP-dependent protease ATPase subunit HslU [Desulfovibrionaceae bacterium]